MCFRCGNPFIEFPVGYVAPGNIPAGYQPERYGDRLWLAKMILAGKQLHLEKGHHGTPRSLEKNMYYDRGMLTINPSYQLHEGTIHFAAPGDLGKDRDLITTFGPHEVVGPALHNFDTKPYQGGVCAHGKGWAPTACKQCGDYSSLEDLKQPEFWDRRGFTPKRGPDDTTILVPNDDLLRNLKLNYKPTDLPADLAYRMN